MSEKIFKTWIVVCIAIFVVFVSGLSLPGCKSMGNFIGGGSSDSNVEDPGTSSGRLWETVKKSSWITPFAIPIIALGAVAMFNGAAKLGMSCIIFGSVNLFMTLASSRFALVMAIFGLIGSGLAVAVSILVKNKALREIIFNNQCIKQTAKDDNVDLVFQDKMKEVLAKQVKSTKKIVAKIKTKMILSGPDNRKGARVR